MSQLNFLNKYIIQKDAFKLIFIISASSDKIKDIRTNVEDRIQLKNPGTAVLETVARGQVITIFVYPQ